MLTPEQITSQINISLRILKPFMEDDKVTDIIVMGHKRVIIKRQGEGLKEMPGVGWSEKEDLLTACNQIARSMDRPLSRDIPLLDARLPDGSRINIVYPPCHNEGGACLSIRKFPKESLKAEKLIEMNSIDQRGIEILKLAVAMGKNILISGGTGSGKTTLLNIISSFIAKTERVVTIEDSRELNLPLPFWTALETKQKLFDNDIEVSLSRLVVNALRMFPRWVVLGEVRGPEAWDLLRCFNTGHSGLCTIHADDSLGALFALESLSSTAVNMRVEALRQYIARAIKIIVQITRFPDESRKVTEIIEVDGLTYDNAMPNYKLNMLYQYNIKNYVGNIVQGSHELVNTAYFAKDLFKFNMECPDFWKEKKEGEKCLE